MRIGYVAVQHDGEHFEVSTSGYPLVLRLVTIPGMPAGYAYYDVETRGPRRDAVRRLAGISPDGRLTTARRNPPAAN